MRADKSRVHATFRLLLLHTTPSPSLSLSPPLPRFHDVPLLRRWAPRRPYLLPSSPSPRRFSAKALAIVERSHKEVISTLRFIRSKVYKGFIPLRAVDENRRATKHEAGTRDILAIPGDKFQFLLFFFSEIFSGIVKSKVNLWKLNIWIDTKLMGKFEIGQGNVRKNIFAIVMISSLIRKITEMSSFSRMY